MANVSSGQVESGSILKSFDVQYIMSGGTAKNTVISAYGSQIVTEGGSSIKNTIYANGHVNVIGGLATSNTISGSGTVIVTSGIASKSIIYSGGQIQIYSGGSAIGITLSSGGNAYVGGNILEGGGVASTIIVRNGGSLSVTNSALANGAVISSGGIMTVGYSSYLSGGGRAEKTTIKNAGSMYVYDGVVTGTTISKGGYMRLGAEDYLTTLVSPIASNTKIMSGGVLYADQNSYMYDVTINKGAKFNINAANVSKITIKSGASTNFLNANVYGTVTAKGAILEFKNTNNVTSMITNNNTIMKFDLSGLIPHSMYNSIDKAMLHCSVKNNLAGKYSLNVEKRQSVGTYSISTNNALENKKEFSLTVDEKSIGTLKLKSGSLTKNGITYTLKKGSGVNQHVTLNLKLKAGKMLKGTTADDTLTGNNHCDIFFGNAGNDTINGINGRDVVVYDTVNWGSDVISKTDGTMTILFKDIKNFDVTTEKSGSDLTIKRNGYTNQKITIKGWSDSTHNIVFGGLEGMPNYDVFLAESKPSTSVTSAARNETWVKAGLLA